jgi:hypothetical protein
MRWVLGVYEPLVTFEEAPKVIPEDGAEPNPLEGGASLLLV